MHPDHIEKHEAKAIIADDHPAQTAQTVKIDPHGALRMELNHRFTYHAPRTGQPALYTRMLYTRIREKAKELALLIMEDTPESREQSLAFTNLEQTVFWANAAIARRENDD